MDRQAHLNKMYSDDINAYLGFDYSHMGYWNGERHFDFHSAQEEYLRQMVARVDLEPGQLVLDVGGGQGGTAVWLAAEYGVRVVVIDAVKEMIEAAEERVARAGLAGKITCVHGDFLDFESSRRFDLILAVEVMYHLQPPLPAFERMRTLLVPGGHFVFSTYVSSLRLRWWRNLYLSLTVGDTDIPTLHDYEGAIAKAGLIRRATTDVTAEVLPESVARLRSDPYEEAISAYHREHYGRLAPRLMPLFYRWNESVMRKNGLQLFFISGQRNSEP